GSAHRFTYARGKDHIVVEQMCLYKEPELCILHVPDGTLPEPVRVELCYNRQGQPHHARLQVATARGTEVPCCQPATARRSSTHTPSRWRRPMLASSTSATPPPSTPFCSPSSRPCSSTLPLPPRPGISPPTARTRR